MLYAILRKERPDTLQKHIDTRPAHLEHLNALNERGTLKVPGSFIGGDGNPNGSLFVVEADDMAGTRALADADPSARAGIFEQTEVRPFRWTVNNPEV